MKILLIAGGWSSEREVSLKGSHEIRQALEKAGNKIDFADPLTDLDKIIRTAPDYDFAFINMHGTPGEDGFIQAILENLGVPYNGSDSAASALALNKHCAKLFFRNAGLNVLPDYFVTASSGELNPDQIDFPAIFKPNKGGSSIWLSQMDSLNDFTAKAPEIIARAKDEFILEPMLQGREITCPVLGNTGSGLEALPLILIQPVHGGIFDYEAKYTEHAAREICPAPIDTSMGEKIADMAKKAHACLKLSGYSRSDFIVPEGGEPIILEINTLPGMTKNSLLPKSAKEYGLSFIELLDKIIALGLKR